MAIRPLGDRVLLKVLDAQEKSRGGIYLPDTAQEKPQQAKVIEAGEGKLLDDGKRQKPLIKKGDVVLFGKYSGTEVTDSAGETYLIAKEEDILAVITK
ncbi:MAG: co-chaperone GroES [Candidatus Omnitrophica bacterium]|nr:co-chaperone GroES [Candidatus Omnitrophota bacterium]